MNQSFYINSGILLVLLVRHGHHFWCTRHAPRTIKKNGFFSVNIWFFSYISLLIGSLFFRNTLSNTTIYFLSGFFILIFAVVGRMISIQQLGTFFSEFIHIQSKHQLITTGIYSVIRHPLHYFLMLELIGLAWIIGRFWGWIIVLLSLIILIVREIQEEKALERAFGNEFLDYKKKAIALIDFLPFLQK